MSEINVRLGEWVLSVNDGKNNPVLTPADIVLFKPIENSARCSDRITPYSVDFGAVLLEAYKSHHEEIEEQRRQLEAV